MRRRRISPFGAGLAVAMVIIIAVLVWDTHNSPGATMLKSAPTEITGPQFTPGERGAVFVITTKQAYPTRLKLKLLRPHGQLQPYVANAAYGCGHVIGAEAGGQALVTTWPANGSCRKFHFRLLYPPGRYRIVVSDGQRILASKQVRQ